MQEAQCRQLCRNYLKKGREEESFNPSEVKVMKQIHSSKPLNSCIADVWQMIVMTTDRKMQLRGNYFHFTKCYSKSHAYLLVSLCTQCL